MLSKACFIKVVWTYLVLTFLLPPPAYAEITDPIQANAPCIYVAMSNLFTFTVVYSLLLSANTLEDYVPGMSTSDKRWGENKSEVGWSIKGGSRIGEQTLHQISCVQVTINSKRMCATCRFFAYHQLQGQGYFRVKLCWKFQPSISMISKLIFKLSILPPCVIPNSSAGVYFDISGYTTEQLKRHFFHFLNIYHVLWT